MKRMITLLAVMLLTLGLIGGAALAVSSSSDEEFTGCLRDNGNLDKVAQGDDPARPCTGSEQQVSWNKEGPAGEDGQDGAGTVVSTGDLGRASAQYGDPENTVDSLTLKEGVWKITASGAFNFDDDAAAPNCGLRADDVMLAKQNGATEAGEGRSGFSVTGALEVDENETAEVHLVCYGSGVDVFEHSFTAIGGQGKLELQNGN